MYPRFLIGFDSGIVCCHSIMVTRFMCQSCRSTHALLPEFVIPFKSHSLFFVLAVLKDYFLSSLTVSQLCAKYEIPPATLYSWKAAFLKDKRIWLGALQDTLTSAKEFLDFLLRRGLEHNLGEFFAIANRSLFQTRIIRGNGSFTPD
ncbi:MAG TPA: transposase [Firmicutes bacterium]|nr:transposase [Bacillota bacterium]